MWLGVLLGAVSLSFAFGSPQENRSEGSNLIFGGEGPLEKPFPPLVQLFTYGEAFCGGTLLNHHHVLTAAHCTLDAPADKITVYAGLAYLGDTENINVQSSKVSRTIVHPFYNNGTHAHDIAILVLKKSIIYTDKIQPTMILALELVTETQNLNVSIYGFGYTEIPPKRKNKHLYRANTTIVPRLDCINSWKNFTIPFPVGVNQICTNAKRQGALKGDSGSPVIYFEENLLTKQIVPRQVGIVSFGNANNHTFPDVHTRASSYCTWITLEILPLETFSCS